MNTKRAMLTIEIRDAVNAALMYSNVAHPAGS
jgi:hypothetical protein